MILITDIADFSKLTYGDTFQYTCKNCGALTTINSYRPFRIKTYSNFLCKKCGINAHTDKEAKLKKSKKTNLKRYGYEFPSQNENIKNKMLNTNLKRYGSANPCKNPNIARKISDTLNNKTDDEWNTIIEKRKNTNLSLYGTESALANTDILNKMRKEYKEKTGYDNPMRNPEVVLKVKNNWRNMSKEEIDIRNSKIKTTKLNKYGDSNYNNMQKCLDSFKKNHNGLTQSEYYASADYQNKIKANNKTKYGVEYYTNREKAKQTCINLYGTPYPMQTDEIKSKAIKNKLSKYNNLSGPNGNKYYYGINFNSSWELAVWIYCVDHNIPIVREPVTLTFLDTYNKLSHFVVDFMINGKLVEIKGDYYFNRNGTMCYPYNVEKVGTAFVQLTPERKKYKDDLAERKRQCGLANGVEFWREKDCLKYIEYCDTKYPGWNILYRKDNPYNPSYWCGFIFNPGYYQRPMYYLLLNKGITPFDCNNKSQYADITGKGLTPFDV